MMPCIKCRKRPSMPFSELCSECLPQEEAVERVVVGMMILWIIVALIAAGAVWVLD